MALASDLVGGVSHKTVPCALVLENEPQGADSRLQFESFPDQIEEAYAVNAYREIAADRMSQPGFVAYRGGNWSSFALELQFRAEGSTGGRNIEQLLTSDIETILLDMERKARWCQALAFPMERTDHETIARVQSAASLIANAFGGLALQNVNLSQLKRNDPPMVFVVFGSFLVLRCYLTNYSLRWDGPFHPVTAQPYGCTVTLTLQRLDKSYPTWETIRNSAGQTQQTLAANRIQGTVPVRATTAAQTDAQREQANSRVRLDNANAASSLSVS